MSYSPTGQEAEKNAKLLISLMRELGATDLGSVCGFFETSHEWCCPCCHRQKQEIARLDKNLELLCAFHWHHDHLEHMADDKIPYIRNGLDWRDAQPYDSMRRNFRRFPETLICSDCNVVEGAAKMAAGAASSFSFTPFEISTFIFVTPNAPHRFDRQMALSVYEKLKPSMGIYGDTLRGLAKFNADPDGFEPIGGAAWRVLADVRKKMKENKE